MSTNLQDQIRGLTDPPAPSGEVDLTLPTGSMQMTGLIPVLVAEVAPVYIQPDPFILTFDALLLAAPTAPVVTVPGSFNFLKAPPKLGRIFAEVIGPGGDIHHPTIEGLVAEETAPGGFQSITGRISERVFKAHPDVYRQDSKMVLYLESDATCIGAGRLNEPAVTGGAVQLAARGHAQRAEKLGEPILYSTQDISIWQAQFEKGNFAGSAEENVWTVTPRTLQLDSEVADLEFKGPSVHGEGSAIAWLPGKDPARITFKAQVGAMEAGNGAFIDVRTYRVGWEFLDDHTGEVPGPGIDIINWFAYIGASSGEYVIEADIDLTLGSGALPQPPLRNGGGDNRGPVGTAGTGYVYPDFIQINVDGDNEIGSPNENVQVDITDIRVYGAATGTAFGRDRFTATELVMDLFGRMGIRLQDTEPSGYDVLPYEIEAGQPYSEGLDFASLLTGWRWLIRDTGHRAFAEFGPWDTRTWEIASPWARLDVVGANRYNRVRIPFTYKDGQTLGSKLARADPDPLDHRSYFGLLGLDHPAMNDERAEALGIQVAKELSQRRYSAQFSIGEVLGPSGPTSGHHVFAGDTLDGSPRGAPDGLRIVSLRRGYSFVEGQCGVDASTGSQVTGVPALDRMLARRAKRLAA